MWTAILPPRDDVIIVGTVRHRWDEKETNIMSKLNERDKRRAGMSCLQICSLPSLLISNGRVPRITRVGSGSSRRCHSRVINITLQTLLLWDSFEIFLTAFVIGLKEELTIVVWTAILPSVGNSIIVGAVCCRWKESSI